MCPSSPNTGEEGGLSTKSTNSEQKMLIRTKFFLQQRRKLGGNHPSSKWVNKIIDIFEELDPVPDSGYEGYPNFFGITYEVSLPNGITLPLFSRRGLSYSKRAEKLGYWKVENVSTQYENNVNSEGQEEIIISLGREITFEECAFQNPIITKMFINKMVIMNARELNEISLRRHEKREVCARYNLEKGYTHAYDAINSFKLGKLDSIDRTLEGLEMALKNAKSAIEKCRLYKLRKLRDRFYGTSYVKGFEVNESKKLRDIKLMAQTLTIEITLLQHFLTMKKNDPNNEIRREISIFVSKLDDKKIAKNIENICIAILEGRHREASRELAFLTGRLPSSISALGILKQFMIKYLWGGEGRISGIR